MKKTVIRYVSLFMCILLGMVSCKRACADRSKRPSKRADQTIPSRLRDKKCEDAAIFMQLEHVNKHQDFELQHVGSLRHFV